MKKIKALVKLDFIFIKTTWIWLFAFLGISLIMGLINQIGIAFVVSLSLFIATLCLIPFELTDKSNLNILYGILPTNRKSMVTARFIFYFVFFLLVVVFGAVGMVLIDLLFNNVITFTNILTTLALAFGIYFLFIGFISPFIYKYSYTKGKFFMWALIAVFLIILNIEPLLSIINIETNFNLFNVFFLNYTTASLITLGLGMLVMVISYFISKKIYLNKNF